MAEPREIALNELRIAVEKLSELYGREPRPAVFEAQALESVSEVSDLIEKAKALLENKKPYKPSSGERFEVADISLKEALATGSYSDHLVKMALVSGEAMVTMYFLPGFSVDKLGAVSS